MDSFACGCPQVELLLSYVQTDVRKAVKMLALTDLRLLAKKGPHMWRDQHVEASNVCVVTCHSVRGTK